KSSILTVLVLWGVCPVFFFFFFSSRRRHTRLQGDWSSDVCSSDLVGERRVGPRVRDPARRAAVPETVRGRAAAHGGNLPPAGRGRGRGKGEGRPAEPRARRHPPALHRISLTSSTSSATPTTIAATS